MKRFSLLVFAVWFFVYVMPIVVHAQTAIMLGTNKAGGNTVQVPVLVDALGNLTAGSSGAGASTTITPNGSFVTDYAGTAGMTTVTSGTTSSFTSTTTLTTLATCTNITGTATLLNLMDGAGAYILRNFSVPANSNISLPSGLRWISGIKASAGAANAINCGFDGKQ